MRTKTVTVHYCEFCRKRSFTKPAMIRHELGCTLNPNRVCGMCAIESEAAEQDDPVAKPLPELIELCKTFDSGWSPTNYGHDMESHQKQNTEKLREAANGCPACMLAAIRQSGNGWVPFDWKEESKAWWADRPRDGRYF